MRINVKYALAHRPGCAWTDGDAPQIGRPPASRGGYEVRVHELDDGILAVVCTCEARSLWRDGQQLPDPTADARASAERRELVAVLTEGSVRPRTIPDVEAAMRAAIRQLTRDGTKLTWQNVATRIATDRSLASLDESTLREWAKIENLPTPADPRWKEPA